MKLKDITKLNLSPQTRDETEVDHVAAIVDDEFRMPQTDTDSYRTAAIKRFIKSKLSFWNNCNLSYDMVSEFVSLKCPYCHSDMNPTNGGGNNSTSSVVFTCRKCKATGTLTLQYDDGLCFSPKK